jgi:hypothetical protein
MHLTPAFIRTDLKCGKGAISPDKKCTKGPATKANTKEASLLTKALVIGGAAATIGGIAYGARKYGKMNKANSTINNKMPDGSSPDPATQGRRAEAAFRQARGVALASELVGAGAAVAGAGLYQYGNEKKNNAARVAGLGVAYLGVGTALGGPRVRAALRTQETNVKSQVKGQQQQYEAAREAARTREAANNAAGSNAQGSRKTGSNKAVKNPFKDLGISESASDAEVKKAWLKLVRANHPDVGGDPRKAATINAAYQEILNRRGKLDSMFADGFNIDFDQIAV